MNCNQETCKK